MLPSLFSAANLSSAGAGPFSVPSYPFLILSGHERPQLNRPPPGPSPALPAIFLNFFTVVLHFFFVAFDFALIQRGLWERLRPLRKSSPRQASHFERTLSSLPRWARFPTYNTLEVVEKRAVRAPLVESTGLAAELARER